MLDGICISLPWQCIKQFKDSAISVSKVQACFYLNQIPVTFDPSDITSSTAII